MLFKNLEETKYKAFLHAICTCYMWSLNIVNDCVDHEYKHISQ